MNLPAELIVHVLSYVAVSAKDLARVSQVSHSLWQASQEDALWATCIQHSNLSFWWDTSEINKVKTGKRKSTAGSCKQFMRDWTYKTLSWVGTAAVKDIRALILGDPAYSEDFMDWLSIGVFGNKRAAITFSIEATILRLQPQVGSLVLNQFDRYEDGGEIDVILIHYSDNTTLFLANFISQNAKKTYPHASFIVTGDPTCNPILNNEMLTTLDAKAFLPIDYRTPLSATTCDALYSLVLTHGARAAIAQASTLKAQPDSLHAKKAKLLEDISKTSKTAKNEETAVHSEIRCDGCGVEPIVGLRHVCTTCKRVDLCAACLAQKSTQAVRGGRCARHAFRQIRKFAVEEKKFELVEKEKEKEKGKEKVGEKEQEKEEKQQGIQRGRGSKKAPNKRSR